MRTALLALCLVAPLACRSAGTRGAVPDEARPLTRTVQVPDVTLYTAQLGEPRGRLRLVVHGGPGLDHTYLRPWLDPLAARARLVYVDLRGHGRSGTPPDANGYTIAAAAADLHALIGQLADGEPADVIAHDFGAEVALELASAHPERVHRLVLVAPFWSPSQMRTMRQRGVQHLGEAGWRRVQELSTPQGTLRDPHAVTELFRRLGRLWWHTPPSDAVLARMARHMIYRAETDGHFLVDAAGWDGAARIAQVRAPTLVISGASDRAFPPETSRQLAEQLPHGRYSEIPAAGHCPFIEQPDQFIATTSAFLRGGPGQE